LQILKTLPTPTATPTMTMALPKSILFNWLFVVILLMVAIMPQVQKMAQGHFVSLPFCQVASCQVMFH
jgi:hypothetical protein